MYLCYRRVFFFFFQPTNVWLDICQFDYYKSSSELICLLGMEFEMRNSMYFLLLFPWQRHFCEIEFKITDYQFIITNKCNTTVLEVRVCTKESYLQSAISSDGRRHSLCQHRQNSTNHDKNIRNLKFFSVSSSCSQSLPSLKIISSWEGLLLTRVFLYSQRMTERKI